MALAVNPAALSPVLKHPAWRSRQPWLHRAQSAASCWPDCTHVTATAGTRRTAGWAGRRGAGGALVGGRNGAKGLGCCRSWANQVIKPAEPPAAPQVHTLGICVHGRRLRGLAWATAACV